MCTIFATKIAHLAWTKTFWQKIHCAKFKEILTADPELWRCTFFGSKIPHLPQTNFFLEIYYYHSNLPISPFHCTKLKKSSSSRSRSMRMLQLLGSKWPISPNLNFFRKPVHEPCLFYLCLSTHQKSKS